MRARASADDLAASPPPRKGERSGDRLLEIAASLFRERGYAATTMRGIAQAAGMQAASLYYHFESKDEILDLVLQRGIGEAIGAFRAALAAVPDGAPFEDRLRAVVTAHLRTVVEFGAYTVVSRQLLWQVPEELRERHLRMRGEYGTMWRSLLDEAAARGEIRRSMDYTVLGLFLLGSLNWSSEWADPRKKSVKQLGEIATELFLRGLHAE